MDDSSSVLDVNLSAKSPPVLKKQESIKVTSCSADENVSNIPEDAPPVPGS